MSEYAVPLFCSFQALVCCKCGISFAVDAQVKQRWVDNGSLFYCPNGHPQYFTETLVHKLNKQLEASKRELEFARNNAAAERTAREHTERRLSARKSVNTRLRNRIKNGVCPCCQRTFMNLQNHMKNQHSQFNKDDGE